jgi:hypothetical protein
VVGFAWDNTVSGAQGGRIYKRMREACATSYAHSVAFHALSAFLGRYWRMHAEISGAADLRVLQRVFIKQTLLREFRGSCKQQLYVSQRYELARRESDLNCLQRSFRENLLDTRYSTGFKRSAPKESDSESGETPRRDY